MEAGTLGRARRISGDKVLMRLTTETKHATKTTEFYAMIVVVAGLLIAGQIDSSGLDERTSWQLATLVAIAYIVSRGLAKIGSQREYYDLR